MSGGYRNRPAATWTPEERERNRAHNRARWKKWSANKRKEFGIACMSRYLIWKANNPEEAARRNLKAHLKSYHKMTVEEFAEMLKAQEGLCKICQRPLETGKKRHLDHDHATGRKRGILCNKCNIGLHYIEDSEFLQKALLYLQS